MNWMSKIISAIIVLLGAIFGVWFYLDNMTPVTVTWFGYAVEGFQLALWLLLFFAAGTLLGLTVSGVQAMRHQIQLQVLRKQLKVMKQKSNAKVSA